MNENVFLFLSMRNVIFLKEVPNAKKIIHIASNYYYIKLHNKEFRC